VEELAALIQESRVVMLGSVRQELLSGVKQSTQFRALRDRLRSFPDIALEHVDYEEAAACFNLCRGKGIQGSNTDFLICAVAARHDLRIFTTDRDFTRFSTVLPIKLHELRE
jgi:predicted nucleic acid-binding protein